MINRYSITASARELEEVFQIEGHPHYRPRYNAAPAQLMPVITTGPARGLSWFYWGLPPDRSRNRPISEKFLFRKAADLANKTGLRHLLQHNRCEVPADGIYIWKQLGRKTLVPHRVTSVSGRHFPIAGTWEEYESESGETHHTFSMVVVPAPTGLSTLTEFIPLILSQEQQAIWSAQDRPLKDLQELLHHPSYEPLTYHTVSPAIEDARLDLPALLQSTPPTDQFGNLTLFG